MPPRKPRHTCTACGRPQADTATICTGCGRRLKHNLTRIVGLWPTLQQAVTRQTVMGPRTRRARGAEQPLPVDLHAAAVADHTTGILRASIALLDGPPAQTVHQACIWLRNHEKTLRRHEAAATIAADIHTARARIMQAIDYPEDQATHPVGPCPQTVDGEPCPGTVHAHQPRDNPRLWFDCTGCGTEWDSTQLTRLGDRVRAREAQIQRQKTWGKKPAPAPAKTEPELVGLIQASEQGNVPIGTLRYWLSKGVLTRYGDHKPYLVDLRRVVELRATRRIVG